MSAAGNNSVAGEATIVARYSLPARVVSAVAPENAAMKRGELARDLDEDLAVPPREQARRGPLPHPAHRSVQDADRRAHETPQPDREAG